MNRTALFLAAAGVLALVALVAGLPRGTGTTATPTPTPVTPVVVNPTGATVASDGSLKLSARLSHPYVRVGQSEVFVTVDVTGVEVPGSTRAPVNLALVIDRSGSMSGFKLNQAKLAARQLVSQLRDTDRLAVVHYGSDVKSMEGVFCTQANKERLLSYIDGIWDDGGTNISSGLSTGRDLVMRTMSDFKVNRMVLISDGQPTEGMVESSALTELTREIRSHGISVTSIGVGTDFNEDLMQAIAEVGAGAYAYLQDASQLATIFQKDLNQAGTQVAHGVSLTFTTPAGTEITEVLGYRAAYKNSTTFTLNLPDFAAGQTERVVARLQVNSNAAGKAFDVTSLKLNYTDLLKTSAVSSSATLATITTDSAEEVVKNQDKDAVVFATRAMSASNTQAAAEAFKQGDRVRASQLLKANRAMYEAAGNVAGAAAVAGDVDGNDKMLRDFDNARDEESVQAATKGAKRKARIDFGLMGSSY